MWGYSSAGRAPALQAGGQEFDSPYLHHIGMGISSFRFFFTKTFLIRAEIPSGNILAGAYTPAEKRKRNPPLIGAEDIFHFFLYFTT